MIAIKEDYDKCPYCGSEVEKGYDRYYSIDMGDRDSWMKCTNKKCEEGRIELDISDWHKEGSKK